MSKDSFYLPDESQTWLSEIWLFREVPIFYASDCYSRFTKLTVRKVDGREKVPVRNVKVSFKRLLDLYLFIERYHTLIQCSLRSLINGKSVGVGSVKNRWWRRPGWQETWTTILRVTPRPLPTMWHRSPGYLHPNLGPTNDRRDRHTEVYSLNWRAAGSKT